MIPPTQSSSTPLAKILHRRFFSLSVDLRPEHLRRIVVDIFVFLFFYEEGTRLIDDALWFFTRSNTALASRLR